MMLGQFTVFYALSVFIALPSLLMPMPVKKGDIEAKPLVFLYCLNTLFLYAAVVAGDGAPALGCVVAVALSYGLAFASRVKYRILGEPVLFTDIISLAELVRNPKFFIFSLPPAAWVASALVLLALPCVFWWFFTWDYALRLVAALAVVAVVAVYARLPLARWVAVPNWRRDVWRLGVAGMLVLYWRRWKAQAAPQPPTAVAGTAARDVVVVVQCESFALPGMFAQEQARGVALPELERAQARARSAGGLLVSGFGAYTMRTEYGVLFGREEQELAFRQYDPFLTAADDRQFSLPWRLRQAGYQSVFMHPHSLAFYGRDRLMPTIGFDVVDDSMGEHTPTRATPYPEDTALAARMIDRIRTASGPLFLYAVTMENHAPWPGAPDEALGHYLRHLRNSDTMLGMLVDELDRLGRKSLLVFFGDHRPSIPGVNSVTQERTTPYVCVEFPATEGKASRVPQQDMTPAALHHLIEGLAVHRTM